MIRENPVIDGLCKLFLDHQYILPQERQSYPPFLFGTFIGEMGKHQLFIVIPEQEIYARFIFIYPRKRDRFYFLNYVVRNRDRIIGKVVVDSIGGYHPWKISCTVRQQCLVSGRLIDLEWTDESLTKVQFGNITWEKSELIGAEKALGSDLPEKVDPLAKIQEVFDLCMYRRFFEVLVTQTPCEVCRKIPSEHDSNDHEYQPFIVHTAANTLCKICKKIIAEHAEADHKFDPDFSASGPYTDLTKYFIGVQDF